MVQPAPQITLGTWACDPALQTDDVCHCGCGVADTAGCPSGPIADFCEARGIKPTALKIDVEGAEIDVLEGARDLIRTTRPVIFLSTHGPAIHRQCMAWLRDLGYTLKPILGGSIDDTAELLAVPDGAIA